MNNSIRFQNVEALVVTIFLVLFVPFSQGATVTVVSPVAVTNSAQQIANGLFSFEYSANVGLSYVIQDSSDLINWLPLLTNVATVNSVQATDPVVAGGPRFYRVVRQPNP